MNMHAYREISPEEEKLILEQETTHLKRVIERLETRLAENEKKQNSEL